MKQTRYTARWRAGALLMAAGLVLFLCISGWAAPIHSCDNPMGCSLCQMDGSRNDVLVLAAACVILTVSLRPHAGWIVGPAFYCTGGTLVALHIQMND